MKKFKLALVASVVAMSFAFVPVWAHTDDPSIPTNSRPVDDERNPELEGNEDNFRKQRCDRRQHAVDHRVEVIRSGLDRRLELLDKVFERVDSYVEDNNVDVGNFEQLRSTVIDRQANATAAVKGISEEKPKLNCSRQEHGEDILEFRTGARAAAHAVNEYKLALKDLIEATRDSLRSQAEDEDQ